MHIIPTQEEVVAVLRDTGDAARRPLRVSERAALERVPAGAAGHAPLPASAHAECRVEPAAACQPRNPRDRAGAFIVVPMTGGLPVAYGVTEALRAKQVYWAEREQQCA